MHMPFVHEGTCMIQVMYMYMLRDITFHKHVSFYKSKMYIMQHVVSMITHAEYSNSDPLDLRVLCDGMIILTYYIHTSTAMPHSLPCKYPVSCRHTGQK